MKISSYGRQGSMGNFACVSEHRQCLLFLKFVMKKNKKHIDKSRYDTYNNT